ncbi:hypothetical protein Tco_1420720 [Tanacetum coccineum]
MSKDDKDNDKGSKSRSQSMKEQAYNEDKDQEHSSLKTKAISLNSLRMEVVNRVPTVLLVQAQANGQILHEEELAFLADSGTAEDALVEKAQQLEPKLYDGNVIKSTSAIVIPESEETLMLADESCSKMLLKQQDPMVLEKKVNTTPVDYDVLNQLSQDFEKRFVPQTELSVKQDFWSRNSMNSSDPSPSCRPTKVEVPKEFPKVSMVNTSLKKLKHHLAGFDMVIKERTMTTAIIEGSWGFEHTKACFRDEIILFVIEQHHLESKTFEVKMNQVLNKNEQLLEQVINKDIVNIIMNSSVDNASVNMHECKKYLKLETELLNKTDFIEKKTYDKLFRSYTTLEKHCISLEVDTQLNQEIFQKENSVSNQSALNFDQYFELNELKDQSQEKDTAIRKLKEKIKSLSGNVNEDKEKDLVITALKDELKKLKGKDLANNIVTKHTIAPEILKFDVEPIAHKLLNNRTAHSDYLRHTQEQAAILREVVKQVKSQNPLNNSLDSTCRPNYSLIGNVTIARVYYVEGLGHNLFSVGQFCDSNLEVAFRQHTCFIRNLEGVDLLTGSRGNNLYTLSLRDMRASSPICLLSKA